MDHDTAQRRLLFNYVLRCQAQFAATGEPLELLLIAMAIRVGQIDDRPMNISSLAYATSLKRTTVIRYLRQLEERGEVSFIRHGTNVMPVLNRESVSYLNELFHSLEREVRNLCLALSKMDS